MLTLLPLLVAAIIAVIALLLWRVRGVRVSRATSLSAIAALLGFQLLFFLQGSLGVPGANAPFSRQLLLTLGIMLTLNATVELAKWALVEFALRPKRLRIPLFLVDLIGWLLLVTVSLLVISHIFVLDLTGLLVSSTVVSAIIALSLQQILGSLFAGITLQLESPFQVDDWVQVDGQEGRVVRLNWRTLTILTLRNECVILPNNQIAQSRIINYTRPGPMVACDLSVGVARIHPPSAVKAVLAAAFADIDGLAPAQSPQVMVWEYTDSYIKYGIRYWFHDYGLKLKLHDAVLTRVWYALQRAEMTLATPLREINMQVLNAAHEQTTTLARQQQLMHTLRPVALFEGLSEGQLAQLVTHTRHQRFLAGETLVREGESGDSLFIIRSGQVDVYAANSEGGQVHVAQRSAGEYFGEMSLLTGAPRSASVVAARDTEVILLDKHAFTTVLAADPTILEALLDALDKRRSITETRLAEESAKLGQTQGQARATLMERISLFLRLKVAPA
ncbi:MAG: mechanosensitive ion channel [Caldilineaceae bacterium]|nr:mechanosensitive ion channel [Caldilineaceae bacterium]